jgi:L-threonylcarbamoyladenylate synthase
MATIVSTSDHSAALVRAKDLLKSGELVCIPTETVYGLAANALNREAIAKIFGLKERPQNHPLIVHIASSEEVYKIADFTKSPIALARFEKLKALWPGGLSLLVPRSKDISDAITAGSNFVAVRVPNHQFTRDLISACGFPLAAPSANKFTQISPTTAQHCFDSFENSIKLILDGGPCQGGVESTVVNICSVQVTILRPGLISADEIAALLNEEVLFNNTQKEDTQAHLSPGQHFKHYAPKTTLRLLNTVSKLPPNLKVGVIAFSSKTPVNQAFCVEKTIVLSQLLDLRTVARGLYSALREMDQSGLDLILIDSCEEIGIGKAIMDRISRALTKDL